MAQGGLPMTADTIAAVIPVYNKEPYVARAITSVLSQTRAVDEIIVVDNASTDGSLARIRAFQDPRIRLLQCTAAQRGPSRARNLAVRAATSRWIAFLDADDEWHEEFIEEIERAMNGGAGPVGCLFTGWLNVWPNGSVNQDTYSLKHETKPFTRLDFDAFLSGWLELDSCPVCSSAIAVRRDILLAAGLFPERCVQGEDKDTWLRVMALTDALGSPKALSRYFRPAVEQRPHSQNVRHCVCRTLEDMIPHASPQRRRLLMRLFNHEVWEYARAVGQREHLSPDVYRGFFVSANPERYLALLALSYLPLPFQQFVRRCTLWARGAAAKPRS